MQVWRDPDLSVTHGAVQASSTLYMALKKLILNDPVSYGDK